VSLVFLFSHAVVYSLPHDIAHVSLMFVVYSPPHTGCGV